MLSTLNMPALPDPSMRFLCPEMPQSPSHPLLANHTPWNQLVSHTAAMALLHQQTDLFKTQRAFENQLSILTPPFLHKHNLAMSPQTQSTSPTSKIAFSIDNIITGKYEESRKPQINTLEHPISPVSCSSASSESGGVKYECETCGKTYATFSGFTKHKQYYCTPQSKKQFNCKHCEKTYFSLGALKMHIRTHTLPCKCKVCGKAFSRPWLLQGHMRTHTGEKPFKCQHCGRAFADRSNLRAHLQTHSDVKKYCCKRCDKTFSRMSLLVKHEESACVTMEGSNSTTF